MHNHLKALCQIQVVDLKKTSSGRRSACPCVVEKKTEKLSWDRCKGIRVNYKNWRLRPICMYEMRLEMNGESMSVGGDSLKTHVD